ncbi:family 10 glycosylhydrolase [Panacibacter ginsenosidivorans]|uniref:Family 10 glycosylhydrolase n=1 Tax=Panacibacter ginsenosidivorans TaxID=1813871 RepID=A0A5B8VAD1_9BACT|nr:family 10 glycosylhydrolase [Panacibacter ginsenosidivorans]QEC67656.1 family 10 glycosylhydrolase [Panacibacter ginsenosidivorans]
MKNLLSGIFFIFFIVCNITNIHAQPKYEFRAAWIATVNNIDWPSKKGLPVLIQKLEFLQLLDGLQRLGINAVIVQIRPATDAFYPSSFEPWSEFLSGVQGLAPSPFYDPLEFMIDEAHKRNMEFHAWLNPYRAVFDINSSSISSKHVTRIHKDWFITYGNKKYFNPGLPDVMKYVNNIVKDILTRYDVDAIHMDDYFYPYRINGKEFPDEQAYRKYGNDLSKDDWRRSNCDSIIKLIHETILDTKPMVKFGISPFGVWRNNDKDVEGSATQAGQTNYDDLYADILLWLKEGWIDYVAPQLYWEIGHPLCDYNVLLNWWANHSYGKHVYIGHGIYRVFEKPTPPWRNSNELPNQIKALRGYETIQGSIYFSTKNLLANPNGWADTLRNNYYNTPALIPPMPWIDNIAPEPPVIANYTEDKKNGSNFIINAKAGDTNESEKVKEYVFYISDEFATLGNTPFMLINAVSKEPVFNLDAAQIPMQWKNCYIAISSVDKENNESKLSNPVQLIKTNKGWAIPK